MLLFLNQFILILLAEYRVLYFLLEHGLNVSINFDLVLFQLGCDLTELVLVFLEITVAHYQKFLILQLFITEFRFFSNQHSVSLVHFRCLKFVRFLVFHKLLDLLIEKILVFDLLCLERLYIGVIMVQIRKYSQLIKLVVATHSEIKILKIDINTILYHILMVSFDTRILFDLIYLLEYLAYFVKDFLTVHAEKGLELIIICLILNVLARHLKLLA